MNRFQNGSHDDQSLKLLPQHQALIDGSAIAADIAIQRGYRSVTTKADLGRLRFGRNQQSVPALLLPVHNVQGEIAFHQLRPDDPRKTADGKPIKYESPSGIRMVIDVPPACRPMLDDPNETLWVTEGIRKADSAASKGLCCIDLLGVWNWRGKNNKDGKMVLACWNSIALNGRTVNLTFDSDVTHNPNVYWALRHLKDFLESKSATVQIIDLSLLEGGRS